jgi:glutamate racemase
MEPAIKPAAEYTKTGLVGVLATPATFQGALYASVVERFAGTVTLIQNTCPGLVQEIELGNLNGAYTRSILESVLKPMLQRGIDTIVLGCTHFPFVIPLIQEIAGMGIRVIDPAPSVARQVARLLDSSDMRTKYSGVGEIRFITSGVVSEFELLVPKLIGEGGKTQTAQWSNGEIYIE